MIREMLLEEHSKRQCDRITGYIGTDRQKFGSLMHLFFSGEPVIAQRAAWPMSYCVRKYPGLIQPYVGQIIRNLKKKGLHDAILRNSLRLLQEMEIPRKYHGQLMDTCFNFIGTHETAVAIKAFALSILGNLAEEYPDILPELKTIVEDQYDRESAAFRSRARKILNNKKR